MNQYLRLPSGSARMAVGYITAGVLMMVWTAVWLIYLYSNRHPDQGQGQFYICGGLMVSGFALMVIGILMGRIGQEAKLADGVTPVAGQQEAIATVPNQLAPQQVMPQQAVMGAAPVQQMPAPVQSRQVVQ